MVEQPREVEWIRAMDRAAAHDAPAVDVASAVMRRIRTAEMSQPDMPFPPLAALIASLLGAAAATVAVVVWLNLQDPMADFVQPLQMVLQ